MIQIPVELEAERRTICESSVSQILAAGDQDGFIGILLDSCDEIPNCLLDAWRESEKICAEA